MKNTGVYYRLQVFLYWNCYGTCLQRLSNRCCKVFKMFVMCAGTCEESELRCRRGPCIAARLHCDDHDQCGDGSDECSCKSWVAGLLSGTICVGFLLTVIAICCCCFKCRPRRDRSGTKGRIINPFKVWAIVIINFLHLIYINFYEQGVAFEPKSRSS
jgi:hypothetical protein